MIKYSLSYIISNHDSMMKCDQTQVDRNNINSSYGHGLILIPAWISKHISYKVWDDINYPFPSFNCL